LKKNRERIDGNAKNGEANFCVGESPYTAREGKGLGERERKNMKKWQQKAEGRGARSE